MNSATRLFFLLFGSATRLHLINTLNNNNNNNEIEPKTDNEFDSEIDDI